MKAPGRDTLYRHVGLVLFLLVFVSFRVSAGEVVRGIVDPGVSAALHDGRQIFLECQVPKGVSAQAFYQRYLANPDEWKIYKDRIAVAIRFDRLNSETQRRVLLSIFEDDAVDARGWWHVVNYSGAMGQETLWSLCEWTTGKGTNYRVVMADPNNRKIGPALGIGQRVLIPAHLLTPVMRRVTANKPVPKAAAKAVDNGMEEPIDLEAVTQELIYGEDAEGPYALYRLKPGEALYSGVVVRFTDYYDNEAISKACEVIQRRSGIKNVRSMKAGQKILIPLEMLSDRYRPKGSAQREEFEQTIQEAQRLRIDKVRTKELEGVVVVIDAGHGGRDYGAHSARHRLYEDEINYDIACRAKRILETQTRAKVYMTVLDPDQGYEPTSRKTFEHDKDEQVLTTPRYPNEDAKVSANLRWYLANSIYRAELKKRTDPRKVVFVSFHTDALYNSSMRGAMVYIPGAKYRRESETPSGAEYGKYLEAQEHRTASSTDGERRRDEALSRNFAEDIMLALGKHRVRRHLEGDWIRSQIRQNGGVVYVPAVLRNTLIPTKVLIEAANMTNGEDCKRLADPEWRQTFAEAFVDALRTTYGS